MCASSSQRETASTWPWLVQDEFINRESTWRIERPAPALRIENISVFFGLDKHRGIGGAGKTRSLLSIRQEFSISLDRRPL